METTKCGQVIYPQEADAAFPHGCTCHPSATDGKYCDWCHVYYDGPRPVERECEICRKIMNTKSIDGLDICCLHVSESRWDAQELYCIECEKKSVLCATGFYCEACCENNGCCDRESFATRAELDDELSRRGEAAQERWLEDYYGGSTPQTLAEQIEVDARRRL
jgi:hypothetical protein